MKLRIVPPHDQQLAQVLDGRTVEVAADLSEKLFTLGAHVVQHADLDQFVRLQRDIDFVQHRAGQSVHADRDHRMKVMRLRAERSALRCGQRLHADSVTSSP